MTFSKRQLKAADLRQIVILLVCLVLLTIGVLGIGYSACNDPPVKRSEGAETAQPYKNNCSSPKAIFKIGLVQAWDFVHGHHEEIIAVGTVFIAIFTVVLGLFTVSLAGATDKLVKGADATARVQLRAYVHYKKIDWKAGRRMGAPWGSDTGWVFNVEWHNSGPTRAREFINHVNWGAFLAFDGDLPSQFDFADVGNPAAGAVYVAPKDSIYSEGLFIESAILEAVRVGHLRLYLWGWCSYRDIFPGEPERETQFCYEMGRIDGDPYELPPDERTVPTISFVFRSCGRHNCADEDCNQET